MVSYEYKVVPAPRSGVRAKGAKGPAGRFASALEIQFNDLATSGWEYIRAESLPVDERNGITRRKTETYHNVLIFRRAIEATKEDNQEPAIVEVLEEPVVAEEEVVDDIYDDFPEDEPELVDVEKTTEPVDEPTDAEPEKA